MSKKKSSYTSQGIRNLNEGFGPRPKRNEIPDNCTLGIHEWSEWTYLNGGYMKVRQCIECDDQDRMHNIPVKVQKPYKPTLGDKLSEVA